METYNNVAVASPAPYSVRFGRGQGMETYLTSGSFVLFHWGQSSERVWAWASWWVSEYLQEAEVGYRVLAGG